MNLIQKIAQNIVDKRVAKEAILNQQKENEKISRNSKIEKLKEFAKNYIEEKKMEFLLVNANPKFKLEEKVLTNYYGRGDSWEGSVDLLQSHTPYRGPIEVKIEEICLDVSLLMDRLEYFIEDLQYKLDYISDTIGYKPFKSLYENYINNKQRIAYDHGDYISGISWAYKIKVIGDDKVYWNYTWRENKLLKLDSEAAKLSIEIYDKVCKKIEQQKILKNIELEENRLHSSLSTLLYPPKKP
jgi:hypothetical protein